MLAAGTVVAAGTQLVATVTRMRSRHLRRALEELVGQLDPRHLSMRDARELAAWLLSHPWLCGHADGSASELRREHFVRLLIEMATGFRLWHGGCAGALVSPAPQRRGN